MYVCLYVKIKDKDSKGNVTLIKIISSPQYTFFKSEWRNEGIFASGDQKRSKVTNLSQIILFVFTKEVKIVKGLCSPICF